MSDSLLASQAAADDIPSTDVVGREVIQARCALLEPSVRAVAGVSVAEIEAVRPGGAENPDTSVMGWLHFLCNLHRMHERGTAGTASARWQRNELDDVRAAMHAEPAPLTLTVPGAWAVYPKGEHALHRCAVIDVCLVFVAERRLALQRAPKTAAAIETLRALVELQARLEGELAWIVTTPGAAVPWPDGAGHEPALPEWTRALDVLDHIAIRRAHLEVNLSRINAIAERTRGMAKGGEALPLPVFMGMMAGDMGVQPRRFAREWSMGEVFVQALLKWEATEKAKADADRDRTTT